MNQRQKNKRSKAAVPKPSLQEAWDIVAEELATTGSVCFFVDPDYALDSSRFRLYSVYGFHISSKPVRGLEK